MDKGILTTKEANDLKREADQGFTKAYQLKSGMPDWVTSFKLNVDFRARYEGNYYQSGEGRFAVDEDKIVAEARYDGKWVLRTNTELSTADVAIQFKRLWMVEQWFRSCKSLLETRPIYHQCDETIRGHVFCSFLALLLRHELQARLVARGRHLEWADVIQDLDRLQQVEVTQDGTRFLLRSELSRHAGKILQAAGVAIPPTVQQLD